MRDWTMLRLRFSFKVARNLFFWVLASFPTFLRRRSFHEIINCQNQLSIDQSWKNNENSFELILFSSHQTNGISQMSSICLAAWPDEVSCVQSRYYLYEQLASHLQVLSLSLKLTFSVILKLRMQEDLFLGTSWQGNEGHCYLKICPQKICVLLGYLQTRQTGRQMWDNQSTFLGHCDYTCTWVHAQS